MSAASDMPIVIKVVMLGDTNVGKTTFVRSFVPPHPGDTNTPLGPTIGVEIAYQERLTIVVDAATRHRCTLQLFDTAGQERFHSVTTLYIRGVWGVIFAYDVTNRRTWEAIWSTWMPFVRTHHADPEHIVYGVIGCKADLARTARHAATGVVDDTIVPGSEAASRCQRIHAHFVELDGHDRAAVATFMHRMLASMPLPRIQRRQQQAAAAGVIDGARLVDITVPPTRTLAAALEHHTSDRRAAARMVAERVAAGCGCAGKS